MAADAYDLAIYPLYPVDAYEGAVVDLYNRVSKRDIARLCWWTDTPPCTLRAWLQFASEKKALFLSMETGNVSGCFWVSDVVSGKQCEFSGWIPFAYRGAGSEQIFRHALDYVHDKIQIPIIYCRTPWRAALAICQRAGMEHVATLQPYHTASSSQHLWIYRSRST